MAPVPLDVEMRNRNKDPPVSDMDSLNNESRAQLNESKGVQYIQKRNEATNELLEARKRNKVSQSVTSGCYEKAG